MGFSDADPVWVLRGSVSCAFAALLASFGSVLIVRCSSVRKPAKSKSYKRPDCSNDEDTANKSSCQIIDVLVRHRTKGSKKGHEQDHDPALVRDQVFLWRIGI